MVWGLGLPDVLKGDAGIMLIQIIAVAFRGVRNLSEANAFE